MPKAAPQAGTPTATGSVVLARILDGQTPPEEWRLLKAGRNDTEFGPFYFTADSARRIREQAERWGNDFSADYEHAAAKAAPLGMEAPAAAWYQLEVRDTPDGPELWATNIRWTERATQYIQQGEYRYISPWLAHDENNEITEFVNFALTNLPATRNMDALIAASKTLDPPVAGSMEEPMSTTHARLLQRLGLTPEASEDAALDALKPMVEAHKTMRALSGMVPDGQDVIGTVTAWRDRATKADELEATLNRQQAEANKTKVEQLAKQGVEEGKLTPASKDALLTALAGDDGSVDPKRLEAYLSAMPKGQHATRPTEPAGSSAVGLPPDDGIGEDGLTEYERIAKQRGHTALARMRTTNPDEFQRLLTTHRAARYGASN